jgi:subtilisin family serine protease
VILRPVRPRAVLALVTALAFLAGCGGGGSSASVTPPSATSAPSAPPATTTVTAAVTANTQFSESFGPITSGSATTVTALPNASASVTGIYGTQQPTGTGTGVQSVQRRPANIGAQSIAPLSFLTLTATRTVSLSNWSLTIVAPGLSASSAPYIYAAEYLTGSGWTTIGGSATYNATTQTFTITPTALGTTILLAGMTVNIVVFTVPSALPTPGPTAAPQTAFACPTSAGTAAIARAPSTGAEAARHAVARTNRSQGAATNLVAVSYQRSVATSSTAAITSREQSIGGQLVRSFDFANTNVVTHVLSVPSGQVASVESTLRSQAGVTQVGATGMRRYSTAVTTPYFTNDPYFTGFAAYQSAPATYEVGPYEETASVPGQWDMHAIGLERAFAYSQSGNGSGIVNANALGSPNVKIAIIDTGEDTTHPELHAKVTYQRCYISGPNNVQSTSNYTSDPTGHGTDVAGIAAAGDNNNLGFTGAGGNVTIYGYRIFPTPDDYCPNDTTGSDPQCGASTTDIASAIEDAIAQHVNVISMSLGGGGCTNGVDTDITEGNAVADAINAGIVVVAAAGNDYSSPLEAPACDNGVIAVGASALADGQIDGTHATPPTGTFEYVASYSDWGSPAASPKSASAWGIVAPGGDPNGGSDPDDLHWVENIWTSQPFMANSSDQTYLGACSNDYPNDLATTTPDCRTGIAGTSMATPHVAGLAALIISVAPGYQSPARMKQLLCTTADDISDPHEGCGRLNAYRAMATALGDPVLP